MSKKIKTYNMAWEAVHAELKDLFNYTDHHFNTTNALPAVESLGPHSAVVLKVKADTQYPLEIHENQTYSSYTADIRFSFQKDSIPSEKGFRLMVAGSASLRGGSMWGDSAEHKRQLTVASDFKFETEWYDKDDALAQAVGSINKAEFVATIEDMLTQLHKDLILL